MPTKANFEVAATKFDTAAQQVGDLTVATDGAGTADILRGGSLGRLVPERMAAAASAATSCRSLIEAAAATCRERIAIIAEYEQQLNNYDRSYAYYRRGMSHWQARYNDWYRDTTGEVRHPGARPRPPTKPTPPPAWADVRRP